MGGAEPVANMKKESKTYSYEDQKWEAELRQELLRKKRAESQGTTRDVKELLKKATKLSQKMKVSEKVLQQVWQFCSGCGSSVMSVLGVDCAGHVL